MLATLVSEASGSRENFASFDVALWIWAVFVGVVAVLLIADLLLVHRTAHVITTKEAAIESAIWIAIGLSFTFFVWWWHGGQAAGEYISGYLIEKSLSVDNVFVWAIIMSYFAVPREFQFRVLFWGVFGALVLRLVFIFAGVALLESFEWMLFVFGAFLIITAARLIRHQSEEVHPENNPVLKIVRRIVPSTTHYDGQHLFTKINGKRLATPLFAVLIVIETSDVVFAVDSIPAILAVSREQFIVFSSNAFAILGLRALYFLLADLRDKFDYLQQGLAVILAFVGVKMIIAEWYHIPTFVSLLVIAIVLAASMIASVKFDRGGGDHGGDPVGPAEQGAARALDGAGAAAEREAGEAVAEE
ncbi:MAG: TerC family protein [Acidimicrobiia bacterium]